MKCICVTGATQPELELVVETLQQVGMSKPNPASRIDSIDLAAWHEQVQAMEPEEAGGNTHSNPGRFMEQLASDIFAANLQADLWGWADTRSVWTLDFWSNFDPRLYFVLVTVSPEQMLAGAMDAHVEIESVAAVMDAWLAYHKQLLRFHLRNPERSILIDAGDGLKNPHKLVEQCVERWKLPLHAKAVSTSIQIPNNPLAVYLAHQLCKGYPQIDDLRHELAASILRLTDEEQTVNFTALQAKNIIADYRELKDRSAELNLLAATRQQLAELNSTFDDAVARHALEQQQAETRLKEAAEEHESLLLHSLQIQEQLRGYVSKHDDLQNQNEGLLAEIAGLTQVFEETVANQVLQQQENEALQKQNNHLHGEIAVLAQTLDQVIASHTQQQQETELRLAQANQENELLLLQLHQVQEELEVYFLKHESVQKQYESLQGEVAGLMQEREAYAQQAAERHALIEELTRQIARHEDAMEAYSQSQQQYQQENELLLLQLHQVQEELEVYFLRYETVQKQYQELQSEVADLAHDRDEHLRLSNEWRAQAESLIQERDVYALQLAEQQAQIEAIAQVSASLGQENAELVNRHDILANEMASLVAQHEQAIAAYAQRQQHNEQENELLLLQLHQVQEELERYFLKHQETQKTLQTEQTRWQRLLQRNPVYCDYEAIKVIPQTDGSAEWRFTNIDIAGRQLPVLEFKTFVENGFVGFVFSNKDSTSNACFAYLQNQQSELILIPTGTKTNLQERLGVLLDISASDWAFFYALISLLESIAQQHDAGEVLAGTNVESLIKGLEKLKDFVEKFPATLRYDRLLLKREQVNPDYEHLWLVLDNVVLGRQFWSRFEFRLACDQLQTEVFGTYPKLEFPEQGGREPFTAWFAESRDIYGAKLELRFAQPDVMDMKVWQRVSEQDRNFLKALIARLPAIVVAGQNLDSQLSRPWDEWIKVAKQIQRIYMLRVPPQPTGPQVAAANKAKA